jgi:peptidoglycan hydrolase CwlO-like protein
VAAAVSLASAEPSLKDKIEAAESQVDRLSGRVDDQSADVSELEADAREAGARAMELTAEMENTREESRALEDDLAAAQHQLQEVQARYERALGVLSKRLVDIYKTGKPDGLTVILESDGFDDLETRAEYLDALNDADRKIADRVEALREEVEDRYEEIADLKERLDEEAARLAEARSEFAAAEASAEKQAAELGELLAGNRAELSDAEGRLADLEAEQDASSGGEYGFFGGPYSIPTYIVMCESGGNYRALNPSSMAGGAYQIIPSTWHAYGGRGYAHQASKAEQDRIAALIWEDVGPSAWSCA